MGYSWWDDYTAPWLPASDGPLDTHYSWWNDYIAWRTANPSPPPALPAGTIEIQVSGADDAYWWLHSTSGGAAVAEGSTSTTLTDMPADDYWVEWGWSYGAWQPYAYSAAVGASLRAGGATIEDPGAAPWCSPAQTMGGTGLTFTGTYTPRSAPAKANLGVGQNMASDLYWQGADLHADAMRARSEQMGGTSWPEADMPWPLAGNTVSTTVRLSSPSAVGDQTFWAFWKGAGRIQVDDTLDGGALSNVLDHSPTGDGSISFTTPINQDITVPVGSRHRITLTSDAVTPLSDVEIVHESYVDFDSPGVPSATQSFRSSAAGSKMLTQQAYEQTDYLKICRWLQAYDDVNVPIPGVEVEGWQQLAAKGTVRVTGVDASTIPYRQQFSWNDGVNTYIGEFNGVVAGYSDANWFASINIGDTVSGQVDIEVVWYADAPNLPLTGTTFIPATTSITVVSPPAGVDATATALTDINEVQGWEMTPYFLGGGRDMTTKVGEHAFTTDVGWQNKIDFCNAMNCDMWVCFPTFYNESYVDAIIDMIEHPTTGLRDGLKVYVEYSNETWNFGYYQFAYTAQMGRWFAGSKIDLAGRPFESYTGGGNPYYGAPLEGFATQAGQGFHPRADGYLCRRLTSYNLYRTAKRYRAKLDTKHGTPYDYSQRIQVVLASQAAQGSAFPYVYTNHMTGWPWSAGPAVTFSGETFTNFVDMYAVAWYDKYNMDPTGHLDTYPTGTIILENPSSWDPHLDTMLQEWIDDLTNNGNGPQNLADDLKGFFAEQKAFADGFGWRFGSYEGGEHNLSQDHNFPVADPHPVGDGSPIVDWYTAYHYRPKFYEKYWQILDVCKAAGFDELVHLGSAGPWAKVGPAGFFPIIETMNADMKNQQKWKAFIDWQHANPKWW